MEKILLDYRNYITTKEKVYFWLSVVFAVLMYMILMISVIGIAYFISFGILLWIMQGAFIGHIKANAVKLSDKQFPEAY